MRGTEMPPAFEVESPAFVGPLELLLQLVERNSLPVTDISLAEVTDSYLRRIETLRVPPEEKSRFLTVASRLLLIKSRYLLPRPDTDASDTEPQDLAQQLRTYQQFKAVAASLRQLEARTSYPRHRPLLPTELATEPVPLSAALLERALRRSVRRSSVGLRAGSPVPRVRLRVGDAVKRGQRLLQRDGVLTLERLAGPGATRADVVVCFLAVLDLIRRRLAVAVQHGLFGEVILYPPPHETGVPAGRPEAGDV